MKSVGIIGAGITGLTAAFYLKRKGISVTIYEAGSHVGGVIQSKRQNGFLAESGPNTILETSPKISALVRDSNLDARKIYTDPKAEARFLVRDKKPIPLPSSPLGFLTTKIFSTRAKLALLREPFVPPRKNGADESVAEYVLRRLNREFLDRAIDPMIAGIYAGDPQKLSVAHAFPRLKALEEKYGSLLKGQIFGARDRKKSGEISKNRAPKFSFDEGLQVLTDAIAAQLGDAVKLNSPVSKISQNENGWTLTILENETEKEFLYDAIIFCGTAFRLAELKIESRAQIDFSIFSEIHYAPVASVVLGFRRPDVLLPCEGFGMLVPKIENYKILGTIFSSSLFPNRAPAGHILLSSYVGGERQPELTALPPEKLVKLVCADLRELLGVNDAPVFQHVAIYPRAIPQYNLGYEKFKTAFTQIETDAPGLFFAGNFRDGISLGDSILSGVNIVEKTENFLK
jgi:oxygen-dependent protoporphyrinogen oxidase